MAKASSLSLFSHSPKSVKGQASFSPLDRSRPFFMLVIGVLLTLTILGAIFYIALRIRVVNLGYTINQEIHSKEATIEENKRLSLEIARLKSPTRLESEAKEKLGLLLPQPHQIIYAASLSPQDLDLMLARVKPLPVEKAAPVATVAEKKSKDKDEPKESPVAKKADKAQAVAQAEPKLKAQDAAKPPAIPAKLATTAPAKTAVASSVKTAVALPVKTATAAPAKTPAATKALQSPIPTKPAPNKQVALAPAPAIKPDKKLSDLDPTPAAPSGTKKVAQAEKKSAPAKPAAEDKKAAEPAKKPVSEKPVASNLLVAKIIPEKNPVIASNAKSGQEKRKSPAREAVPAVMLDSMP